MDNLLHGCVGYLIAHALPPGAADPAARRTWSLAAVVAAEAPDLDFALYARGTEAYLAHHRGLSHSYLAGATLSAAAACWLGRRGGVSRRRWFALLFLAFLSHVLLDLLTSFGTMPWSPFGHARESWDVLFIVDPTLWLASGLGAAWAWRRSRAGLPGASAGPARAALAACVLYVVGCTAARLAAEAKLEEWVRATGTRADRREVLPALGGLPLWTGFVQDAGGLTVLSIRLGGPAPEPLDRFPAVARDALEQHIDGLETVRLFRWFARFPVETRKATAEGVVLDLFDARFVHLPNPHPFTLEVRARKDGSIVAAGFVRARPAD